METEFEVKIPDIDVEQIKKKLESIGAKKHLEREMKRYVYDIDPKDQSTWIRLRDNGERVTLAIKKIHNDNIDGTKEISIVVDDFEKTNLLLNKLGFFHKAYQENKRISYLLDDVKIEIDFWPKIPPKIPPYLEVEGKSAQEVEKVVKLLGFDSSQTTSIGVTKMYQRYGIDIDKFKELKF
jgi:adenylate cyclase class 2